MRDMYWETFGTDAPELGGFLCRYFTMLEEAKQRGIVEGVTNLYDEYWSDPSTVDACTLPYLEGDYWIGEAENIIKVRYAPASLMLASLIGMGGRRRERALDVRSRAAE